MRIKYNKLIRDQIPAIIEQAGKKYAVEVMETEEYKRALLEKLVEEAQEAADADAEKLEMELADLFEVIHATMKAYGIDFEDLKKVKEERKKTRGGFDMKIKLLWTE